MVREGKKVGGEGNFPTFGTNSVEWKGRRKGEKDERKQDIGERKNRTEETR